MQCHLRLAGCTDDKLTERRFFSCELGGSERALIFLSASAASRPKRCFRDIAKTRPLAPPRKAEREESAPPCELPPTLPAPLPLPPQAPLRSTPGGRWNKSRELVTRMQAWMTQGILSWRNSVNPWERKLLTPSADTGICLIQLRDVEARALLS